MATRFILSIDGGGIRGIVPAMLLAELQKRMDAKNKKLELHRYFSMVAGTSTGAIIAAALTCPHPKQKNRAAATPDELVELFVKRGPDIFPASLFSRLANGNGLLGERYDEKPLEDILIERLGTRHTLRKALTKVLIPAYNIRDRRAEFFTNADEEHDEILFWQAVRGSSAAPTYFEPALVDNLEVETRATVATIPVIDGGMFANDPSLAAYVEARKLGWESAVDGDDVVILSLGTGSQDREIPYQQAKRWGALGWINPGNDSPLISILMQGQSSTVSYQLNKMLNGSPKQAPPKFVDGATVVTAANKSKLQYYRITAPLGQSVNDALDDASKSNIANLQAFAQKLIKTHTMALDAIAERIEERPAFK